MDKKAFCDEMVIKLVSLDRYFHLQRGVPPATAHKADQQEKLRPRREEAQARVAVLRGRLGTVCADAAPLTDAVRTEIEQQLAAVMERLK